MPAVIQADVKGDTSYEGVPVQSTAPLYRKHHGEKSGRRHWVRFKEYLLNKCENFAHYKIQNSFMIYLRMFKDNVLTLLDAFLWYMLMIKKHYFILSPDLNPKPV